MDDASAFRVVRPPILPRCCPRSNNCPMVADAWPVAPAFANRQRVLRAPWRRGGPANGVSMDGRDAIAAGARPGDWRSLRGWHSVSPARHRTPCSGGPVGAGSLGSPVPSRAGLRARAEANSDENAQSDRPLVERGASPAFVTLNTRSPLTSLPWLQLTSLTTRIGRSRSSWSSRPSCARSWGGTRRSPPARWRIRPNGPVSVGVRQPMWRGFWLCGEVSTGVRARARV